jgi:hypothetical protein
MCAGACEYRFWGQCSKKYLNTGIRRKDMKSKQKLITIMCSMLAVLLLLTACTSATPIPLAPSGEHPEVPAVIRQAIAERLNFDLADLEIEQVEQVDWPDACLGLAGPDEMCAEVITPGFRLTVRHNGELLQIHTDLTGAQIRQAGERPQVNLSPLASKLGVELDRIEIQTIEAVTWPDTCLGAAEANELCAQVLTPGYGGILTVDGMQYEFRLDHSGENVRLIPGAVLSARQILATRLGVSLDEVRILQIQPQEWPDACLGLDTEGQLCAQVITPGYQVFLEVDNTRYEYRTDESGDLVVLASAPQEPVDSPIIIWSFSDENGCQMAHIGEQDIAAGPCNGPLLPGRFASPDRQARLTGLAAKFAAFRVETQAGEVSFNGQGRITATPNQQRMIAEWSRLVAQEAISGRSGASWVPVFTWDREGGIAGFCDHLEVFASGEAYVSDCRAAAGDPQDQVQLNDSQLRALYSWLDNYASFEHEQSDPATADGMTIRIDFFGSGNIEASEGEILAIQELAAELFAQGTTVQNPADLHGAIQALSSYLSLLNDRQYSEAVQYFAGSTEELAYFNPEMDPNDAAGLFEAACTINGFVCLPVLNVVDQAQVSTVDFKITVELQDRDGSPFVFGPCCGADPALEPPQTQFVYTVSKVDGRFLVQETPLYVP